MTHEKKRKPAFKDLIFTALGFLAGYLIVYFLFFNKQQKKPEPAEVYPAMLNEVNKHCPVMVDEFTRLDSSSIVADSIFCYNYTLPSISKEMIKPEYARECLDPGVIENALTNPEMAGLRELGIPLLYRYYDLNGEKVHEIFISSDMYR